MSWRKIGAKMTPQLYFISIQFKISALSPCDSENQKHASYGHNEYVCSVEGKFAKYSFQLGLSL